MAQSYGQYCPLALAAEILAQRWTILVLSRLMDGCTTFNSIHRGVPRISPSLLSQRLLDLERAELIVKSPRAKGTGSDYTLTAAGLALEPIIEGLAVWGQNWGRDMVSEDLDPAFLAWSMHTRIDTEAMPPGRTVLEFRFEGAISGTDRFWLIHDGGRVEMCLKRPDFDRDLLVRADLRRFVETWRGLRDLRMEIRSRRIRLEGDRELQRAFPDWLLLSSLAPHPRLRSGRERRTALRSKR